MWGSAPTRQQLRDCISRLVELNQAPEGPKESVLDFRDSSYQLSIWRENVIARALALLSARSNNKLNVTAVCIEEYSNGKGIAICIPSNT